MLQRLPIALAKIKAGNAFENLLNETRQIIYSLYLSEEITKKVYILKIRYWRLFWIYLKKTWNYY